MNCSADGSADIVGGGAVAGRKAVDFENLAFAQGNHLMTNKKCDLPQKSYRAAHKASSSVKPVCMLYAHVSACKLIWVMLCAWHVVVLCLESFEVLRRAGSLTFWSEAGLILVWAAPCM